MCEYETGTYTLSCDDASTCIILEKISDFEEIFFSCFLLVLCFYTTEQGTENDNTMRKISN